MALKFVTINRPKNNPTTGDRLQRARLAFITSCEKQRGLVAQEVAGTEGEGRKARRMYFQLRGIYYVDAIYGVAKLKLDGEHTTIEAGVTLAEVDAVFAELIAMVDRGELDAELEAASNAIARRIHPTPQEEPKLVHSSGAKKKSAA